MKIAGKRFVAAPYAVIESILADGRRLATAVPHFQLLSSATNNQHKGRVMVLAGPLQDEYEGTFVFTRPQAGIFAVSFEGHGVKGVFRGHGRIQLEAQNEQTIIHYEGDVAVAGQLAAVPSRLLQANLNAIARRTLEGIDRLLWPERFVAESLTQPYSPRLNWRKPAAAAIILAVMGGLSLIYFLRRQGHSQTTNP